VGYLACIGIMRHAYYILVGKPSGKSKRKWEGTIKLDIK
jgi:hypothetical protein